MENIDINELEAVKIAVRDTVSKFTYMGVNVGSYVTDDEISEVAIAAMTALENYRNSKQI